MTALAIDPNCGKRSTGRPPCRLWVACRRRRHLADATTRSPGRPTWIAPPAEPADQRVRLAVSSTRTTRAATRSTRARASPTARATPRPGLGLFKSTDGGQTWTLVAGSQRRRDQPLDRRDRGQAGPTRTTIYIGTDVARHGSSSVNGGRRTPPNAPAARRLQVDRRRRDASRWRPTSQRKTPPNPTPAGDAASTGSRAGSTSSSSTRTTPTRSTPAVFGYGVWRSNDGGTTWRQIFHTVNETDFSNPTTRATPSATAPSSTSSTSAAARRAIYVGDSSDDLASSATRLARRQGATTSRRLADRSGNSTTPAGRSSRARPTGPTGFLAYGYCQNGQCGYDDFVVSPAGQRRSPATSSGSAAR